MNISWSTILEIVRYGVYVDIVTDDTGDMEVRQLISSIEPGEAWARVSLIETDINSHESVVRINWEDIIDKPPFTNR